MNEQPLDKNGESSPVAIVATIVVVGLVVVGIMGIIANSFSSQSPVSQSSFSASDSLTSTQSSQQTSQNSQQVVPHRAIPSTPTPTRKVLPSNTTNNQIITSPQSVPQQTPQISYSPAAVGADLAPRLAFITCDWYNQYGNVLFSKTSNGLLGPLGSNGSYFINTVLGGLIDTSYNDSVLAPSTCTISFPAGVSLYAGGYATFTVGRDALGNSPVIAPNMNIDFGQIAIKTPNGYVTTYARSENYCSARPSVNDSIAVFGWPTNGTGKTLTGSIIGTSGYYDTTNIVVPDGMQGSTAVSLSSGCTLGQINASGQIADMSQLSYLFGW